jgi:hypothetical protein
MDFILARRLSQSLPTKDSGLTLGRVGGAAAPLAKRATPDRSVRMAWRGYANVGPNRTTAVTIEFCAASAT